MPTVGHMTTILRKISPPRALLAGLGLTGLIWTTWLFSAGAGDKKQSESPTPASKTGANAKAVSSTKSVASRDGAESKVEATDGESIANPVPGKGGANRSSAKSATQKSASGKGAKGEQTAGKNASEKAAKPDLLADYTPPYPSRENPFELPADPVTPAMAEDQSHPDVRVLGFANVDGPRAIVQINGKPHTLGEGDRADQIELVQISAPQVTLQYRRQRWTASINDPRPGGSKVAGQGGMGSSGARRTTPASSLKSSTTPRDRSASAPSLTPRANPAAARAAMISAGGQLPSSGGVSASGPIANLPGGGGSATVGGAAARTANGTPVIGLGLPSARNTPGPSPVAPEGPRTPPQRPATSAADQRGPKLPSAMQLPRPPTPNQFSSTPKFQLPEPPSGAGERLRATPVSRSSERP